MKVQKLLGEVSLDIYQGMIHLPIRDFTVYATVLTLTPLGVLGHFGHEQDGFIVMLELLCFSSRYVAPETSGISFVYPDV